MNGRGGVKGFVLACFFFFASFVFISEANRFAKEERKKKKGEKADRERKKNGKKALPQSNLIWALFSFSHSIYIFPTAGCAPSSLAKSASYCGNRTISFTRSNCRSELSGGCSSVFSCSSACSIARPALDSSVSGYATTRNPSASSWAGGRIGVSPCSTRFAIRCPPVTRAPICASSSACRGASMNSTSQPISAKRFARHTASSRPSGVYASVRATTTRSCPASLRRSRSSSTAAMRRTASSRGTTALPATCPHRFGATWSSTINPAKPACAYPRTVRCALSALPKPVSASPMTGMSTAWQMLRPWSTISPKLITPASGAARRLALTPKPLMNVRSKPARSIRRALKASKAQGMRWRPPRARRLRSWAAMCLLPPISIAWEGRRGGRRSFFCLPMKYRYCSFYN
eukprot:Rhum_TRINITY_DN13214_c0_g2::Rhum_TRINITY_DN13214_c0_g2_i1::g.58228::m.58228